MHRAANSPLSARGVVLGRQVLDTFFTATLPLHQCCVQNLGLVWSRIHSDALNSRTLASRRPYCFRLRFSTDAQWHPSSISHTSRHGCSVSSWCPPLPSYPSTMQRVPLRLLPAQYLALLISPPSSSDDDPQKATTSCFSDIWRDRGNSTAVQLFHAFPEYHDGSLVPVRLSMAVSALVFPILFILTHIFRITRILFCKYEFIYTRKTRDKGTMMAGRPNKNHTSIG
ncbi:hypothetical protein H4582DRAFT_945342 [Lactarius indigo]|nr:hypothetical protein H4582DRAFT_945342 [Lactarius indigo]